MNQILVPTPVVYFDERGAAHIGGTNIPVRNIAADDAPIAIRFNAPALKELYRAFDGALWTDVTTYTQTYYSAGLSTAYRQRPSGQSIGLTAMFAQRNRHVHELWPSTSRVARYTDLSLKLTADTEDDTPGVLGSPMLDASRDVADNAIVVNNRIYRRSLGPRLQPDTYGLTRKPNGKLSVSHMRSHPTMNIYSFRLDELEFALDFCGRFYGKPFVFEDGGAGALTIVEPSLIPKADTMTHSLECMNWTTMASSKRRRLSELRPALVDAIIQLRDAYKGLHGNADNARFFSENSAFIWPHFEWETEFPDAERIAALSFEIADLDTLNMLGVRRCTSFARRRLEVATGRFDPATAEPVDDEEFAGLGL